MPGPARPSLRRDTLSCFWCPEWGTDSHTSCLPHKDFRFSSEKDVNLSNKALEHPVKSCCLSGSYSLLYGAWYNTMQHSTTTRHSSFWRVHFYTSLQHCVEEDLAAVAVNLIKGPFFTFLPWSFTVHLKLTADGGEKRRVHWWFFPLTWPF